MTKDFKLNPSDLLNLPDAPDFISEPPKYTVTEMAEMCEKMLFFWNKERFLNPPLPIHIEPFILDN
jgi:hypothetical protein